MDDIYIEYIRQSKNFVVNEITIPHIKNIYRTAPDTEYEMVDDRYFAGFSTICVNDTSVYTKIRIPTNTKYIYFIMVHESDGGQSYHEMTYIIVGLTLDDVIDYAMDYYETEHNWDNECEECMNDNSTCQDMMLNDLRTEGCTVITTTMGDASMAIYKIPLV